MSVKTKIAWAFALSVVGLAIGYIFSDAYGFGLCVPSDPECHQSFLHIAAGLICGFAGLSLVFLILFLIPEAVSAWFKFSIWYIPFAIYAMATSGPGPGGHFIDLSPNDFQVDQWISIIYVIVCLIIIGWKYISLRKKMVS